MSESIREMRKICQESRQNALFDVNWSATNIFRKVSIYFTMLFLRMKISANQVTVLSLLVGVAGGVLLTFGNPVYWIAAALLLYLFVILDLVDGEIARYKKTASPKGAFWDLISGVFVWRFTLACASFGVYSWLNEIVVLIFGISAIILLSLYHISHFSPYRILHEKGLLLKALEDKPERSFRGVLRYGQVIFGQGIQGWLHGILVASLLDCFVPLPEIAGMAINFRFAYLAVYTMALLIGVIAKIRNVAHYGVTIRKW